MCSLSIFIVNQSVRYRCSLHIYMYIYIYWIERSKTCIFQYFHLTMLFLLYCRQRKTRWVKNLQLDLLCTKWLWLAVVALENPPWPCSLCMMSLSRTMNQRKLIVTGRRFVFFVCDVYNFTLLNNILFLGCSGRRRSTNRYTGYCWPGGLCCHQR